MDHGINEDTRDEDCFVLCNCHRPSLNHTETSPLPFLHYSYSAVIVQYTFEMLIQPDLLTSELLSFQIHSFLIRILFTTKVKCNTQITQNSRYTVHTVENKLELLTVVNQIKTENIIVSVATISLNSSKVKIYSTVTQYVLNLSCNLIMNKECLHPVVFAVCTLDRGLGVHKSEVKRFLVQQDSSQETKGCKRSLIKAVNGGFLALENGRFYPSPVLQSSAVFSDLFSLPIPRSRPRSHSDDDNLLSARRRRRSVRRRRRKSRRHDDNDNPAEEETTLDARRRRSRLRERRRGRRQEESAGEILEARRRRRSYRRRGRGLRHYTPEQSKSRRQRRRGRMHDTEDTDYIMLEGRRRRRRSAGRRLRGRRHSDLLMARRRRRRSTRGRRHRPLWNLAL